MLQIIGPSVNFDGRSPNGHGQLFEKQRVSCCVSYVERGPPRAIRRGLKSLQTSPGYLLAKQLAVELPNTHTPLNQLLLSLLSLPIINTSVFPNANDVQATNLVPESTTILLIFRKTSPSPSAVECGRRACNMDDDVDPLLGSGRVLLIGLIEEEVGGKLLVLVACKVSLDGLVAVETETAQLFTSKSVSWSRQIALSRYVYVHAR